MNTRSRRRGSPVEGPTTWVPGREDTSDCNHNKRRHRSTMSKTQLVKRLRLSFHDWQHKRNRLGDRRTTARESTIALLKKARRDSMSATSDNEADSTMVDPITREYISRDRNDTFAFRRGSTTARIDASALIDYILATGDYSDPESRVPFDDIALLRLDQIGSRLGKSSVLKAREELQTKFAERQFLRDAMCGLERVCGESVSQMFDLVEQVNDHHQSIDDAHIQLLTFIIPEFQSNFAQLVDADRVYAKHSAMQFEAFLRGPPNRPMKATQIQLFVMELFRNAVAEAMND